MENDWDNVVLKKHYGNSKVYAHMQLCTLKDGVNTEGCPAFCKKLTGENKGKYMVCMICKDVLEKPLGDCLVKCRPGDTSNGTTHLNGSHHKKYLAELEKAKEEETKKKMRGKNKEEESKKRKRDGSMDSFLSSAAASKSSTKKSEYKKRVAAETNQLIHEFVNNGAHPDTVVTDDDFRKLINHLIEHGQDLKGYYQHMGQRKYVNIEEAKFDDLIEQVSELIREIREWYVQKTGRRVRFISVSHDVWDGKRKKINGVSLFFVHPETLEVYRIPIGLAPPLGADAQKLFRTCKEALDRVGVEEEDIFRPVNDNCATAKKTGRLLLCDGDEEEQQEQPDGSCDMHFGNLYTGLALSLVTRTSGGRVVNRWAPFQDLLRDAKKMAKWLCDKKNKRYEQYENAMSTSGGTRVLRIPNETRVAGVLLLLQDLLCSFHTICEYGHKCTAFSSLVLTRRQWQQLAEFEAIIRAAYTLCFESQGDRPEVSAEMTYRLANVNMTYQDETRFNVVNLNAAKWPATTPFNDLPTVHMTTDAGQDPELSPMSDHSVELTGRLVTSYEEYFSEPNLDRCAAMIAHPLFAGSGFEELKIIREEEGDGDTLFEAASEFFLEAMVKTTEDESSPAGAAADASTVDTVEDEPSTANPPSTRREKLKKRRLDSRKNKASSSQDESKEDRAKKAFNEYMEAARSFDATEELKKQCSRMEKNASEIDWARVKDEDLLYISSKFDVLEWWNTVGAGKYPNVLVAALPILGLPASNAFQERIFSACTWHDDPLNQSLHTDRFEKKVLLGVNKDFRKGKGKSS